MALRNFPEVCLQLPRVSETCARYRIWSPQGSTSHSVWRGSDWGLGCLALNLPGWRKPPLQSVTHLGKSQLSKCSLWDTQDTVGVSTLVGCHPRMQCSGRQAGTCLEREEPCGVT